MITVTLKADNVNVSLQKGDTVYATMLDNDQSGTNANSGKKPVAIGTVIDVVGQVVKIDDSLFPTISLTGEYYLFFSKDRRANLSGILGYYASIEYRNYSLKKAEIFATGTEYAPSSK